MDAPEEPQPPVVYTMENKPIVTCAGDQNLFTSIYPTLSQQLPREPMEWRRSYGRAPKMIHLESNFVQFKEELLPKEGNKALLTFPFLHIYWTECCDTEVYKATVKDDLTKWQNVLKAHSSVDWLIVVVENDAKKKNKTNILPRTSIVDKIRNDFCNKQSDRCVVLSDPLKDSSRTQEALSSVEAFEKHYLDLSHATIEMYTSIGRIRSAKLVGKDLAEFYMRKRSPQKAEMYLQGALKNYLAEGWALPVTHTREQLEQSRPIHNPAVHHP